MNTEIGAEHSIKPKPCSSMYVLFAALIASIGGILFGYDIGIVSGALLQLKGVFGLSSFQQELVVSGVIIGAFCASFFGGNIVDTWGRKAGIVVSCVFFIAGSLVLYFSVNFIMLVIGRFIVGIAVSLSVTAECTYISEISPPSRRGMMVSINEVGITIGFLIAYFVNYLFISTHNGWKYMFGVATIPAILQVLGVSLMPSSHHYLLIKGKTEKAREVLKYLRNNNDPEEEIDAIISSIDEQKSRRFIDLFSSNSNMRGRMILGMTLVFLQQFSGNANVLYYAPTVFQHFGYHSDISATFASVGLGVVKVIATIITLLIVDKVGRKSLLMVGSLLMATSIIILGAVGTFNESHNSHEHKSASLYSFNLVMNYSDASLNHNTTELIEVKLETIEDNIVTEQNETLINLNNFNSSNFIENIISNICLQGLDLIEAKTNLSNDEFKLLLGITNLQDENNQTVTDMPLLYDSFNFTNLIDCNNSFEQGTGGNSTEPASFFTKVLSVVSLMTFVCAYSMSYGPVTWLILSEIFPGSLRGRAISVATCINWGSNIVVSLTFLDILNVFGIGPTFIVYGFICYAAALFIFFCVPETKNRSLEEINEMLSKGMTRKSWKCGCTYKQRTYSIKSTSFSMDTESNFGKENPDILSTIENNTRKNSKNGKTETS